MPLYTLETHSQLQPFLAREWLLTNGLGSFASSTVVGCNTRRYHGLLVAATNPPVGRMMTLGRLGELIQRPSETIELYLYFFILAYLIVFTRRIHQLEAEERASG